MPAIAAFWGDMDAAGDATAAARATQMTYQQCGDRFVVRFTALQDNDDSTWANTATVTLITDGTVEISYGDVQSGDILVGVFDGTHTADRTAAAPFASTYSIGTDTGVVLFDAFESGAADHRGELDGQTIRFTP